MADAISYTLKVDGASASPELLSAIRQIDVEDHAELADMLRLRVAIAVKPDSSGWTLLDDGAFPRLSRLDLTVTVGRGNPIPLMKGHVVESDAQFAAQPNGSLLTVVAMDPTVLMHLEERVRAWPNMADSDVATAIFSDAAYGFTPVVESTRWTRNEDDHTLIQRGTDIRFLQELAERNGYECFVETNPSTGEVEGHFHPPRHEEESQGTLSVNSGSATNVNKFRVRYDMLGATTAQATVIGAEDGSDQSGQAQDSGQSGLGSSEATSTDRPRKVLLSGLAMGSSGEVQRYAQAVVDRSAWSIVAEGELNTIAYGGVLRAKRPVMVRGVGRQLSGRFYVEKVLHTITSDGAFTQKFTLRRNAVGLTGRERFQEDGALPSGT